MGTKLKENSVFDIPIDLLHHILTYLPVKSLCRFKSVCKQFRTLISEYHFCQTQYLRRCNQDPLLLVAGPPSPNTVAISLNSSYDGAGICGMSIRFPLPTQISSFEEMLCCKGLVCLVSSSMIYVCNPLTRELIALPCFEDNTHFVGFGFVQNKKQFKILRVYRKDSLGSENCSEIITLGNQQWTKRSGITHSCISDCVSAPFLHGAIHFISDSEKHGRSDGIAVFDLDRETYIMQIPFPESYYAIREEDEEHIAFLTLNVVRGHIWLTISFETCMEVWILIDYSGRKWAKRYSVDVSSFDEFSWGGLIAIMGNGRLLFRIVFDVVSEQIYLYNHEDERLRVLNSLENHTLTLYFESLFSLPMSNVRKRRNSLGMKRQSPSKKKRFEDPCVPLMDVLPPVQIVEEQSDCDVSDGNFNNTGVKPEPESDDEIAESDIELEGETVEPDSDLPQKMGDPSIKVTEENRDASQTAKEQAMKAVSEGKLGLAIEKLTEAISLNPSSIMYATRANVYIKMKKPCAAICDADVAVENNPNFAKGYKSRGIALDMLGKWEEAMKDLQLASALDCDEELSAVLKKVESNAHKIEEHRRKYDRLRKEREEKEIERERKRCCAEAQSAYEKEKREEQSFLIRSSRGMPGSDLENTDLSNFLNDPDLMLASCDPRDHCCSSRRDFSAVTPAERESGDEIIKSDIEFEGETVEPDNDSPQKQIVIEEHRQKYDRLRRERGEERS